MIEKGQYVKVVFKNSTQLEGVVESWTEKQAILRSVSGDSLMIIQNTSEDVMAIKIILDFTPPTEVPKKLSIMEEKFEAVRATPVSDPHRLQRLADLRKQANQAEKEIIANKLKDNRPEPRESKYGFPNLTKKHSSK